MNHETILHSRVKAGVAHGHQESLWEAGTAGGWAWLPLLASGSVAPSTTCWAVKAAPPTAMFIA